MLALEIVRFKMKCDAYFVRNTRSYGHEAEYFIHYINMQLVLQLAVDR